MNFASYDAVKGLHVTYQNYIYRYEKQLKFMENTSKIEDCED